VYTTRCWNNRHYVDSKSRIGKPNNLKVFGSKKTQMPEKDSKHLLSLSMAEED